jgi:hypothetical protein
MDAWWEPDFKWPDDVPVPLGAADLDCYEALFRKWGFEVCATPDLEAGYLKIALYAAGPHGNEFEHVAKQLPSGAWSSKGGPLWDFRHGGLDAVGECGIMRNAKPTTYMRRPYDGTDQFEMEENGIVVL